MVSKAAFQQDPELGSTLCPLRRGQASFPNNEIREQVPCCVVSTATRNITCLVNEKQGQKKLNHDTMENAFNLPSNFTQSKMYFFF
jgi:hypothetical protein